MYGQWVLNTRVAAACGYLAAASDIRSRIGDTLECRCLELTSL